ncbi:MAG: glutaredoxin family protein [Acidimicrobiales bacterium]
MADATVLYCRAGCATCEWMSRWLTTWRVPFEVRDVLTDQSSAKELADRGFATLPVTVTPDGHAAAGADPAALFSALPSWPRRPGPPASIGTHDDESGRSTMMPWNGGWAIFVAFPLTMILCLAVTATLARSSSRGGRLTGAPDIFWRDDRDPQPSRRGRAGQEPADPLLLLGERYAREHSDQAAFERAPEGLRRSARAKCTSTPSATAATRPSARASTAVTT